MQVQTYIWETRLGRIVMNFCVWQNNGGLICQLKMHSEKREHDVIFKESSNGKIVIHQGTLLGEPVYGTLEFFSEVQSPLYTLSNLTIGTIPNTERLEGVILEWVDQLNPQPNPTPNPPLPYIENPEEIVLSQPDQNSPGMTFPMVNLQPWPLTGTNHNNYHFLQYKPTTPQSLYASLLSAPDLGAAYKACEDFIQTGSPLSSIEDLAFPFNELPANYFALLPFDNTSIQNTKQWILEIIEIYTLQNIIEFLNSTTYKNTIDTVWQNWYLLYVLNGTNPSLFIQLTAILRLDQVFSYLLPFYQADPPQEPEWSPVAEILRAVIISFNTPFKPISGDGNNLNSNAVGATPYSIGQLEEIEHILLGYVKGEISHVENIMQGEKRSLSKRKKDRLKEGSSTIENQLNEAAKNQADTTESMEYEWMKAAAEAYTQYNFTNLTTTYTPPNIFNYAGAVTEQKGNTTPVQKTEGKFLENHFRQGLDSIKKQVYSQRVRVHSELTEEIALSEWDNSGRDQSISGYYRWLNKLYLTRHYKKDNRLFAEINLHDQASGFIAEFLSATGVSIDSPKTLKDFGINSYSDLDEATNEDNYIHALSYFGISREQILPPDQKQLNVIVKTGEQLLLDLPEGYEAVSIQLGIPSEIQLDSQTTLFGIVGTSVINSSTTTVPNFQPFIGKLPLSFSVVRNLTPEPIQDLTQAPPPPTASTSTNEQDSDTSVNLNTLPTDVSSIAVSVQIQLQLISREKTIRQVELFNLLKKKYDDKYSDFLRLILSPKDLTGPLTYSELLGLIKTTLKKSALTSLLDQFKKLTGIDPLASFDTSNPGNYYLPAIFQFFELVFEWNEMQFLFVSNHTVESYSTQQTEENKNAFLILKMLHSESVRVILPVKKNQSLQALYFMTCGIPWAGDQHFTPVFGQNIATATSILSILHYKTSRQLLSEWKYEIPTRLLILTQNHEN